MKNASLTTLYFSESLREKKYLISTCFYSL